MRDSSKENVCFEPIVIERGNDSEEMSTCKTVVDILSSVVADSDGGSVPSLISALH